ncbi:nitroreductase family deazaflavin-dependent oxidoreductase [Amycolatopsis dongchuanensis]|uniref:Nitroreductase family deazaflavin-dependent oxidoreductase n=1 Tax=Amycolatopsis dongchuanensis TaxID=1070866 RepID=A0ABP9R9F1_9PSEU
MVLPKGLARFNRVVTNRLLGPLAGRGGPLARVVHRGRRSGREYRTPVGVFPTPTGYAIPLTYGPDTDWVRNVLAAGACELEIGGGVVKLTNPRVVRDERRTVAPAAQRFFLALTGMTEFLYLDRA